MEAVCYVKVSTKHGSEFHQIQSTETVAELVSRATGVDTGQIVSAKARKVDSSQNATDAALDMPAVVLARDFGCRYMEAELKCDPVRTLT